MKAYYEQIADQIYPIYGVSCREEAEAFCSDKRYLVETKDDVYMNIETGSVDFESGWIADGVDIDDLTLVEYDADKGAWVEVTGPRPKERSDEQ